MNSRRLLSTSRRALGAIPLAVAMLMGTALLVSTSPAMAAKEKVDKKAATSLAAAPATSLVEILVSGTVDGEPGFSEAVAFSNVKVQIGSTLILDEFDPTNRRVALDIAMVKPEGVGLETKAKYVASYSENLLQVLESPMQVDATFTFGPKDALFQELSGMLSLTLTFDENGVITGATGSIQTIPVFVDPTL